MASKGRGWHDDSRRHSLSRKGIKTNIDQGRRFDVSNFVARGKKVPEVDVSRSYWSMKINPDGTMKLTLGNWTDAGWFWSGEETDLGIFLYRIMRSGNKEQFMKDMEEEGITYEMLLPTILEHIDDVEGNAMYSLTGDNQRWKFGETFDLDVGSELDHFASLYELSDEDREEIEETYYQNLSGEGTDIDKFEKTELYQDIKKKLIHELKTSGDFEDYGINMDNLQESVMEDMLSYDSQIDSEQFSLAFEIWIRKKKDQDRIVKKIDR